MVVAPRLRLPIGCLGALALIAAVEATLGALPGRFADPASLNWRLSLAAAEGATGRNCAVACVGDSLMKIGVLPGPIAAATGRTAHNFAMGRAPAPASYFLLQRMIAAGARPQTVVVDFKPSMLAGGPKFNLRQWQEVLRPGEMIELTRQAGGAPFLAEIAVGRLLPSWRGRWEIREAIGSALLGQFAPTFRNNRLAQRNWGVNGGTHLNGSRAVFDGTIPDESRRKLIIPRWECHRANVVFVRRFLDLADAHGINVVWLVAPSSPELQDLRVTEGGDAAYIAFIREQQRRHPRLVVVDGRHAGYPTAAFADATHLNARGTAPLSRDLGAILAALDRTPAPAPRWLPLPPFTDQPLDPRAEDIDRSTAIVDAELRRR